MLPGNQTAAKKTVNVNSYYCNISCSRQIGKSADLSDHFSLSAGRLTRETFSWPLACAHFLIQISKEELVQVPLAAL